MSPRTALWLCRTDTNGAYLWNGSAWVQLINSSSMPAALIAQNPVSTGSGVYELQMAPSNSSIMYMMFNGYVFKSTNKGTTWAQTAFTENSAGTNPNDSYGQVGQKMAVDPNNSNIVYVGTEERGDVFRQTSGASWTQVSQVPTGSALASRVFFFTATGRHRVERRKRYTLRATATAFCQYQRGYYLDKNLRRSQQCRIRRH